MIVFPNCKINLGLTITGRRADGFHNLETVFYPVAFTDILEVITDDGSRGITMHHSGLTVNGSPEDNICVKAYHLLSKDFPLPPVQLYLHKSIPMGAGLGGGSADGAFVLQLLNNKYQLGLSTEALVNYAMQLGSDCPFFVINTACYATGRGELLEPVSLDLSGYSMLLVNPGIHINTGWAFNALQRTDAAGYAVSDGSLKSIVQQPVDTWKNYLVNDFEQPVGNRWPQVMHLKESLYAAGAVYASMSGSGSTVFGLFAKNQLPALRFPAEYTVMKVNV